MVETITKQRKIIFIIEGEMGIKMETENIEPLATIGALQIIASNVGTFAQQAIAKNKEITLAKEVKKNES